MSTPLSREWSTPRGLVGISWAFALTAALWLIFAGSAVDRLFIGVLMTVLVAGAAYAGLLRPRLSADAEGIAVRGLRGTVRRPWSEVAVRIQRINRFGRTVETLELDITGDELIILGKFDLGDDPRDVAEALESLKA